MPRAMMIKTMKGMPVSRPSLAGGITVTVAEGIGVCGCSYAILFSEGINSVVLSWLSTDRVSFRIRMAKRENSGVSAEKRLLPFFTPSVLVGRGTHESVIETGQAHPFGCRVIIRQRGKRDIKFHAGRCDDTIPRRNYLNILVY